MSGQTLHATLRLCLLILLARLPQRAGAEDSAEHRFENYQEDADRIHVQTQALRLERALGSRVTARGLFVYDAVSGATPTGAPPPPGTDQVPLVEIEDSRYAGSLDFAIRSGRHTTTPQIAYSQESDYQSVGLSLNHGIDFNEKNTTLNLGIARNFDRVKGSFQADYQHKETLDLLVGVNQILGPRTHLTVNLSFGYADGYLTAADFYQPQFTGDPLFLGGTQAAFQNGSFIAFQGDEGFPDPTDGYEVVDVPAAPAYYSSDYRLSELQTFNFGIDVHWRAHDRLSVDAGYRRYVMEGLDGQTSQSAYPSAHTVYAGLMFLF